MVPPDNIFHQIRNPTDTAILIRGVDILKRFSLDDCSISQYFLAQCFLFGWGVNCNLKKALLLFEKSSLEVIDSQKESIGLRSETD